MEQRMENYQNAHATTNHYEIRERGCCSLGVHERTCDDNEPSHRFFFAATADGDEQELNSESDIECKER